MKISKKPFTGLHVLGEITTVDEEKLKSLVAAKRHIHKIIRSHKLNELGSFYYKFPKGGGFIRQFNCLAGMPTFTRIGIAESLGRLISLPKLKQDYLSKIFGNL